MDGFRRFDKEKDELVQEKPTKIVLEEGVPVQLTSLQEDIEQYLKEELFDKTASKPLDKETASVVTKKMLGLQKDALRLVKYYDKDNKDASIKEAEKVRSKMDEIVSKYILSSESSSSDEERMSLYTQLLMENGLNKDEEFATACSKIKSDPEDRQNYTIMKKLIGEYLGQAILAEALVSDESTSDIVKVGKPLFDRVLSTVYIIQKIVLKKEDDFKDSERAGLITGQTGIYGWVVGEIDSLFVVIDPMTTYYLPVIILEAKGGALSSASVAKQTSKEKARIGWVRDNPKEYALATRKGKKTGPFIDITARFDLSGIDEWLDVSTSGPIRKKDDQQYDITFNLTPEEVENLARYIVFAQK